MKKYLVILMTFLMLFVLTPLSSLSAQDVSGTVSTVTNADQTTKLDSLQILVNQLKGAATVPTGTNSTFYLWLFFSILGGVFVHAVANTLIAVKKKESTPNYFSLSYWFNENLAYKITMVLGFIVALPWIAQISGYVTNWWFKVFIVLVGLLIGWFIDWIVGKLQAWLKLKAELSLKK